MGISRGGGDGNLWLLLWTVPIHRVVRGTQVIIIFVTIVIFPFLFLFLLSCLYLTPQVFFSPFPLFFFFFLSSPHLSWGWLGGVRGATSNWLCGPNCWLGLNCDGVLGSFPWDSYIKCKVILISIFFSAWFEGSIDSNMTNWKQPAASGQGCAVGMARCRRSTTNWKYPLTSGGVAHSRRVSGTTLRHHTGCSWPRWQLNMPTPPFPSCTYLIWVFLSSKMMWPATTLSREKLRAHTGLRGWRRGLRTDRTSHLPVHTCSPAPVEPDACPHFHTPFQWAEEGKKPPKGTAAASPGKGASPNKCPDSRRENCVSPPCKPLPPGCFFPGKLHLAVPEW